MSEGLKKYNEESYVHFISTVTFGRYPYFQDPQACQILANNIRFYQRKFDLEVFGWVIMPDHLHLLVWWDVENQPTLTVSRIMHGIKWHSAKQISEYILSGRSGATARPAGMTGQGARALATRGIKRLKIWQSGFYDFNIYSEQKLQEKIDYLKTNVIKAGLADDWQNYQWIYLKYS